MAVAVKYCTTFFLYLQEKIIIIIKNILKHIEKALEEKVKNRYLYNKCMQMYDTRNITGALSALATKPSAIKKNKVEITATYMGKTETDYGEVWFYKYHGKWYVIPDA